jgi:ParB family transcriptional regulator, chromosome partitioning protein
VVRQSGLGRGLGALLPSNDVESTVQGGPSARLVEIPIGEIKPNTYQPRSVFDDDAIAALAASIKEIGVLQPILVRPAEQGYELIAGERRWRAARRAGLSTIPAVVKALDDHGALEEALVENLHRADLNPLEEAAAFQQLIEDFNLTHDQVAQRVGKSRAAVSNTLRLFQLSPGIQRLVMEGKLNAGHARALLGTTDKAFQESLARRCVAEELSVRSVEEAVRLRNGAVSGGPTAPGAAAATPAKPVSSGAEDRPAGLFELEEVLGDVLSTRVAIALAPNRKGKVTIEFADLADLERIFRIMTASAAEDVDEPENLPADL